MMKKNYFVAAVLLLTAMATNAEEKRFVSPDGQIAVTVNDEGGKPVYQVSLGDKDFLGRSPLGLKANFEDLTQGLTLKACNISNVKDAYQLKTFKQKNV